MSDAWDEIQAIKTKRNTLREKLEKRKKERQDIFSTTNTLPVNAGVGAIKNDFNSDDKKATNIVKLEFDADPDVEKLLLLILADDALILPINTMQLCMRMNEQRFKPVATEVLNYFLQKLAAKCYINIKDVTIENKMGFEVILVEHTRIQSLYNEILIDSNSTNLSDEAIKRKVEDDSDESSSAKLYKISTNFEKKIGSKDTANTSDILSLLSMPSTREKQSKQVGEEILELLSKPTAKERSLAEKFKSQGGAQVMEFCPHGTRVECLRSQQVAEELQAQKKSDNENSSIVTDLTIQTIENNRKLDNVIIIKCAKLHFKKIIQSHTDESLGDCSFLNTCFHMDSCKYVHYEVDSSSVTGPNNNLKIENEKINRSTSLTKIKPNTDPSATLQAPQWIQCDLRFLDMTVLGKFAVIMADPPWDIHMELPYGTMSDDEMRQLGIPALQDDGLIFLWVTGRAMELGRECLKLWGYERVDELIWVKTNQLQRIIRTGRTGHWLNHGKEHCLVGTKGNQINLNCGLDCDVIVAEVRATSHKPDEIYGIIERLSPGTRKIELFGRPHNIQPNWITLGNQLDGIRLVDPELIKQFQQRYPDGNCMAPSQATNTVL